MSGILFPNALAYKAAGGGGALDGSESDGTQLFGSGPGNVNMSAGGWGPVNASWTTGITSPSGATNACTLVESAATASHFTLFSSTSLTSTISTGGFVTLSIYAKMSGRRYLGLRCADAGDTNGFIGIFDLQTGAFEGSHADVGNGTWNSCTVATGANGYTKCSMRGVISTGSVSNATVWWGMNSTPNTNLGANYAGDGTSGIILWRPKLVLS